MRTLHKLFVACCLVGWAFAAAAQSYPDKAVRFIVPYPAGGYYDLLARVIGQKLTENWGQSFVVENRVGANGMLGTDFVAKSPPDGYTILMGGIGPFGISPSLYPKMLYDPVRDFAPVIHVASSPNVLVVHPSVEARSVQELIALARSNPGKLTFSSAGIGSSQHLSGEMFDAMAGVNMRHIPYKGSAPSVTAVLAGEVSLLFGTMPDVVEHVRAGTLRALAVTSARRIPVLPDLATVSEAGVAGFEVAPWFGVFTPARVPGEIIAKLNREIGRILQMPDVLERISQQGSAEIVGGSPEQYGAFVRAEIAKWAKVVKESGAKVD